MEELKIIQTSLETKDSDIANFLIKFKKKLKNNRIGKILFVNPPDGDKTMFRLEVAKRGRYNNNPPYGLGLLATVARSLGIQVEILNLNHEILKSSCNKPDFDFDFEWKQKIKEKIELFRPDIVGVSCLFTMTHESFKQVIKYIYEYKIPIICGGVHISNDPENVLADIPEIDIVFLREAEVSFRSFLININNNFDFDSLGQMILNDQGNLLNILKETRPEPKDFDIHPAMDIMKIDELSEYGCVGAYKYLKDKNSKISTVLSNRGCRGKCTFCCVSTFNGRGVRKRSVISVVDEIEKLKNDYGVNHITWLDDDLLADPQRCLNLFNEIQKRNLNITWDASNGLISAFVTEEIIQAAAESGCIGLVVGVESGCPEILKQIKKPGTVDSFRKAAKILKKFPQIYSNVFLMIGFPNETISQIKQTIDLAFEMDLDWYKINTLQPLPSTPIYDSMLGDGMIEQSSLAKIHFDKQGGYGKIEDIESNKNNVRDTVEKIFQINNDNHTPSKNELTDIWLYMVYHLNFERLLHVNSDQKAKQHKCHLEHISTRVLPNHAFALYYIGILDYFLNKKINEDVIFRLKNQLKNSIYWRERFISVGLRDSIHDAWKVHLSGLI